MIEGPAEGEAKVHDPLHSSVLYAKGGTVVASKFCQVDDSLWFCLKHVGGVRCAGINKWVGIKHFLEAANLEAANVLAIGDGMNDYDMLLNAGVSVAVDNAKDAVKDVADRVFDSNDNDGVAKALQYYLLRDCD